MATIERAVRCGVVAALVSVVDRLCDAPLGELLDTLPMSETTVCTLPYGTEHVGEALDRINACELMIEPNSRCWPDTQR